MGCHNDQKATDAFPYLMNGEYGHAREIYGRKLTQDKSDRMYILDRMRLAIVTLADGYPHTAEPVFSELYDMLAQRGVNADRTVESYVLNEDLKIWKGEPFEQAMALAFYSMQKAELGSWDNARAAAQASLFRLKDPSESSAKNSNKSASNGQQANDGGNSGYAARNSDFTLGYLLNAVANQQLGREDEARDNFNAALQVNPSLRPLIDDLRGKKYNTILVVSYGLGPRKTLTGPDGSVIQFNSIYPSGNEPLLVQVGTGQTTRGNSRQYPVVTDLNTMANEHIWLDLEEARQIKSNVGTGLLLAGAGTALGGGAAHSNEAAIAGLGLMALGAIAKAGSHADPRYCDAMPQRVYLVPLDVVDPSGRVLVRIEGGSNASMVLTGLSPPTTGAAQLRYVSLVPGTPGYSYGASGSSPSWAVSGQVNYANDSSGARDRGQPIPGSDVPYILGGRSVQMPTYAAIEQYHHAGQLTNLSANDLIELYRVEGIQTQLAADAPGAGRSRHVLEGGTTLESPFAFTAGFARLFGQVHPPYQPRTPEVHNAAQQPSHPQPTGPG